MVPVTIALVLCDDIDGASINDYVDNVINN